jgi:hypothetical protein
MGWRSRATVAQLNNLAKSMNPQNPTIEEVLDNEDMGFKDEDYLEHGFFFLDEEPTSEEDSDSDGFDTDKEVNEDKLEEWENEADIAHFNVVLAHAQAMAIKAECKAAGKKQKHKWHYMGNSVRTKWHHAQKRRELAATGQTLISSMFTQMVTELTPMEEQEAPPDAIEIVDDPDSFEAAVSDARFISTCDQGLSSSEAAWANQKCYGHQTLPPEMATKLKNKHEKRYGAQANNLWHF